ncbi:tetratricopeptide repeat protein [Streptomyces sp. LX-29]|uniref:tetratricopeptide repeat protein n=1 Tax=Streptomyces sp. LX-29 TaxID=2900152 RepID=UPI00240DBF93|nr:tetratricopeptide repeat protein [Streptomyces sp. LX-29]WFB08610.1 tetratricopeptide repeat protein [Streptomyces sp. LX-29]
MSLSHGPAAAGGRSAAADSNSGVVATGDNPRIEQRTLVLPPDALRPAVTEESAACLNNLPNPASTVFEGREDALETLASLPSTGTGIVAQSVRGMGGVGKSTLVLHHARRHLSSGRGPVWWITAESAEEVTAGLAALAVTLNPVHVALPLDEAAAWAVSWLQGRTGWLLVLDNVEDAAHLHDLLGRLSTGQVLITTRRHLPWDGMGALIYLDTLHPEASLAVLRDLTGRREDADTEVLNELAAELGHLPLALQQAGAYLARTCTSPSSYVARFRDDPAAVLATTTPGDPHQRTIARLWHLSFDALQAADPNAVYLLRILAYLGPTPLPRSVLEFLPIHVDVDQALGLLAAYSMVSLSENAVVVHRLLQAVLRTTTLSRPSAKRRWRLPIVRRRRPNPAPPHPANVAVVLLLTAAERQDPREARDWPYWQELLPHVQAAAGHYPPHQADADLALLLNFAGIYARARGRAGHALPLDERALAIAEAALGSDHPTTAVCLGNLAATYGELGRHAEALPLEERALAIAEAVLGSDHPSTGLRLGNLAATYGELGRHAEALPLKERALAIAEAALGSDHPTAAVCLGNLAVTYGELGRHAEALPLKERALAITEAVLGSDHPDTGLRLGNLAMTYGELGRHAEALPLQERALAITEAALGSDHPTTAVCLGNLAMTYGELGRHAEALPLKERALAITEAVLGSDHPDTAVCLGNLAATYGELGRHAEALPLQERALAITEAVLGSDHPDTGLCLGNLAATYSELGRHAEALPLEERALAIAEAVLGSDHPSTGLCLGNLAATYSELGRHAEALPLQERALAIAEAVLGSDHPSTGLRLGNLAATYSALGRHAEALPLKERALAIAEAALGSDHPDTGLCLGNLAATYGELGRHAEALPLQERALAIIEAVLGSDHPDTGLCLGNLAVNYGELGRHAEALPLQERALAITEATLGPDHPKTAVRRRNLARAREALNETEGSNQSPS